MPSKDRLAVRQPVPLQEFTSKGPTVNITHAKGDLEPRQGRLVFEEGSACRLLSRPAPEVHVQEAVLCESLNHRTTRGGHHAGKRGLWPAPRTTCSRPGRQGQARSSSSRPVQEDDEQEAVLCENFNQSKTGS
eukprot:56180-Eustigmatos_ZCMA.PRE.1